MARNVVVCLDGTGNEIEDNLSNVLKLYRIAPPSDEQVVYYDQGVGTIGHKDTWGAFLQKIEEIWGLATGFGIDKVVLRAYEFLIDTYKPGDQLFLFGFSRGAYSARMLAGFIYTIGILAPEQRHLAGAALSHYKACVTQKGRKSARHFRRILRRHDHPSIRFVGVCDTVSSVIIPRPGHWLGFTLEKLEETSNNPAVEVFRQALSVDERRRMFRPERWLADQRVKPNPYAEGDEGPQDWQEVWFAGVHSDVGGGYPRDESSLSQIPLLWLVHQAEKAGLKVYDRMVHHVGHGVPYTADTLHNYPAPNPLGKLHNSMTFMWSLLEYLPKPASRKDWPARKTFLGWYIPAKEPRYIAPGCNIHAAVKERMDEMADYQPVNLPGKDDPKWSDYVIVDAMKTGPQSD